MSSIMKGLWKDERGQDLTEYALLVVLVILVSIASITILGTAISNVFSNAAANMTTT
jgi:Flp pilus assembly pilin Flp